MLSYPQACLLGHSGVGSSSKLNHQLAAVFEQNKVVLNSERAFRRDGHSRLRRVQLHGYDQGLGFAGQTGPDAKEHIGRQISAPGFSPGQVCSDGLFPLFEHRAHRDKPRCLRIVRSAE